MKIPSSPKVTLNKFWIVCWWSRYCRVPLLWWVIVSSNDWQNRLKIFGKVKYCYSIVLVLSRIKVINRFCKKIIIILWTVFVKLRSQKLVIVLEFLVSNQYHQVIYVDYLEHKDSSPVYSGFSPLRRLTIEIAHNEDLPNSFIEAFLKIENLRFYNYEGVTWVEVAAVERFHHFNCFKK